MWTVMIRHQMFTTFNFIINKKNHHVEHFFEDIFIFFLVYRAVMILHQRLTT